MPLFDVTRPGLTTWAVSFSWDCSTIIALTAPSSMRSRSPGFTWSIICGVFVENCIMSSFSDLVAMMFSFVNVITSPLLRLIPDWDIFPTRIFGPHRSPRIPIEGRFCCLAVCRMSFSELSKSASWPWEKLMRNNLAPLLMSFVSVDLLRHPGPTVATIFVSIGFCSSVIMNPYEYAILCVA